MATYIPGVQSYLPNFQPFTPDYKFLSNVLDTKTQKYNTNYKAVNDLYSKVVYGNLSREDTKVMRDQYAENLGPRLQQISGMDLSVMQNMEAAKSIFKPFFEEDLIVKDLVTTKQYQNEMQYANMLQNSPNQEQREMYWTTGLQKMQYEMQDFISADEESALKMATPKYIPDADLKEMATEYLKESGLEVEIDQPSPDGMWIIKRKNGDLITNQALQMVQGALKDDPRVVNAYQADAYVRSRKFADDGIKAGKYSNIDEGQTAWATEQISRMEQLIADKTAKLDSKRIEQKSIVVSWENYESQYGITKGGTEEKEKNEVLSKYDALEIALSTNRAVLADNKGVNTKNKTALLHRAYSLLMNYNMESDLQAAAIGYSNIGKKIGLEVNPYGKMREQYKYDIAKMAKAHDYKMIQQAQKAAYDKALAEKENENQSDDMSFLGDAIVKEGERGAMTGTGEGGELDVNADFYAEQLTRQLQLDEKISAEQVDIITAVAMNTKQNGDSGVFEVAGITGSLDEIKSELLKTDETGALVHSDKIRQAFNDVGNTLKVKEADRSSLGDNKAPVWLASDGGKNYHDVLNRYNNATSSRRKLDVVVGRLHEKMKRNTDIAMQTDLLGTEGFEAMTKLTNQKNDLGEYMPSNFYVDNDGVTRKHTKESYIKSFQNWAKNAGNTSVEGTILDDTGYFTNRVSERTVLGDDHSGIGWGQTMIAAPLTFRSSRMVVDKKGFAYQPDMARDQAIRMFDEIEKLSNYTMTGGLDTEMGEIQSESGKTAAYSPMFELYDINQAMRGVADKDINAGEIASNPVYEVIVDPLSMKGDAYTIFRNLYEADKSISKAEGKQIIAYDVTKGDYDARWNIFTSEWDEESEIWTGQETPHGAAQVDAGEFLLQQYFMDIQRMQQKSPTKSKYPNATIEYFPSISADPSYASTQQGMEGNAGYQVNLSNDFVKQFVGTHGITDDNLHDFTTISIGIPKKLDKNPKRFGEFNFSSYATEIASSPNKVAVEAIPRGGKFKLMLDGNGAYNLFVNQLQLNSENGEMDYLGETHISEFVDSKGQPFTQSNRRELDAAVQKYNFYLQALSIKNFEQQIAWKKQHNVKLTQEEQNYLDAKS